MPQFSLQQFFAKCFTKCNFLHDTTLSFKKLRASLVQKKCTTEYLGIAGCRKLPPATGKYTTSQMVIPTMRITDDICLYSRTELTVKTTIYSIIFYDLWKYYLTLMYMNSKTMQRTNTSKWSQSQTSILWQDVNKWILGFLYSYWLIT